MSTNKIQVFSDIIYKFLEASNHPDVVNLNTSIKFKLENNKYLNLNLKTDQEKKSASSTLDSFFNVNNENRFTLDGQLEKNDCEYDYEQRIKEEHPVLEKNDCEYEYEERAKEEYHPRLEKNDREEDYELNKYDSLGFINTPYIKISFEDVEADFESVFNNPNSQKYLFDQTFLYF